jgi:hypothetical protein
MREVAAREGSNGSQKKLFTFKEPRRKFEIKRKILKMREKKALKLMQLEEEANMDKLGYAKENGTLSTASSNQIKSGRYV